jgi:hypothetical protein
MNTESELAELRRQRYELLEALQAALADHDSVKIVDDMGLRWVENARQAIENATKGTK